jgi:pyrophosphate--fructose-6-phosphate 1-phosphotransferase
MPVKENFSIEDLMKKPEAQEAISDVNHALIERTKYVPETCAVFSSPYTALEEANEFNFFIDKEAKKHLPSIIDNKVQRIVGLDSPEESFKKNYCNKRNIGIVFSGGPAPGGHNVLAGLYDSAKKANPKTKVYGFLLGPDGIIENEAIELTGSLVDAYRNLGGFGMIKTGRTKIDTKEKMALSKETCKQLELDALVIVGGDDSNTNAAFLAQEMFEDGIQVLGVPKTIDGDIQVKDTNGEVLCAMSFGFHSAARAFAQEISNLCTDSASDVKYWHICKVMGRSASHLAIEVALQTHAHIALVGEDLADYVDQKRVEEAEKEGRIDYAAYGMTLERLYRLLGDCIARRAAVGKNYGVIVIPEGVLECINEIQVFIIKLNTIIAEYNETHQTNFHSAFPSLGEKLEYLQGLARDSMKAIWNERDDELFNDISAFFQEGLLIERDRHGNFQFSQVETDKVIMRLVKEYLNTLRGKGLHKIGIEKTYYRKTMKNGGLDPDYFGSIIFKDYDDSEYLIIRESIISLDNLKSVLTNGGAIKEDEGIPAPVQKIFKKSVPKFGTQLHFYGYDGRGTDPTRFDCTYTYNLGLTVFNLIANGATGQMAAIRNLELDFSEWEPMGIPIAPLMHLEERKGKLALVLEKSVVEVDSNAFRVVKACREKWLGATPEKDTYRRPGPIRLDGKGEEDRPITLTLNALRRK